MAKPKNPKKKSTPKHPFKPVIFAECMDGGEVLYHYKFEGADGADLIAEYRLVKVKKYASTYEEL